MSEPEPELRWMHAFTQEWEGGRGREREHPQPAQHTHRAERLCFWLVNIGPSKATYIWLWVRLPPRQVYRRALLCPLIQTCQMNMGTLTTSKATPTHHPHNQRATPLHPHHQMDTGGASTGRSQWKGVHMQGIITSARTLGALWKSKLTRSIAMVKLWIKFFARVNIAMAPHKSLELTPMTNKHSVTLLLMNHLQ